MIGRLKTLARSASSALKRARGFRLQNFAGELFCNCYYRVAFGRSGSLASSWGERVAAWERRQCRGDIPLAPEVWETQYRQGLWRCLSGLDELARYGVIAGYLRALKPSGAILDIGCGEGLLAGSAAGYSRYVGIDVSEAALARARQRYRERCSFSQADARAYVPGDRFDAVIFNEVLYYFDDPLAVVSRYERWLRADGVIIASLYQHSRRAAAIAKRLKARYRSLATVEIRAGAKSWSVSVLAPESKPEA